MESRKNCLQVGIIGAGAISGRYIETIQEKFPVMKILCVCSRRQEKAAERAAQYGIESCTLEDMLQNDEIDMVINLTPVGAHYEIIKRALLAGKHVYTEKTMTDDPEKARELIALADEKGLYLGSAPDTFLGSAIQTARKAIDDGLIGEVTSFAIAANRNNNILLSMFPFLRLPGAGLCYDYAVYHMTALVSLLGEVERVGAMIRAPYQTHVNILPDSPEFGKVMNTPNESELNAILQLKSGVSGTIMINADSILPEKTYFAVYGTEGILYLPDPNQFGEDVLYMPNWKGGDIPPASQVLSPVNPYEDESRGLGAADMAEAILTGKMPKASKELAAHVLDVLSALKQSSEKGCLISIESDAERPDPLRNFVESIQRD